MGKTSVEDAYFPHDSVRPVQNDLMTTINAAINNARSLIVHAPTGLGKTAASLAPTLRYAIENNKTIFFLTSRHTQHKIAVETLQNIKEKFGIQFDVVDVIGKKWMCQVPGTSSLRSSEFVEYCRAVKKDHKCEFYENTRKPDGKYTMEARAALTDIRSLHIDGLMKFCNQSKFCPYEMSMLLATHAKVIVADYNYMFNPAIRNMILGKMDKDMSDVIMIVDEAHNLPFRIRELLTSRASTGILSRAIKEAQKYEYDNEATILREILEELNKLASELKLNEEKLITRNQLMDVINIHTKDLGQFIENLNELADLIREDQKSSFVGSFALFLDSWQGDDDGFVRILSKKEGFRESQVIVSYRCLDPSVIAAGTINTVHSSILMSGTLQPSEMYRDLLGVMDPMTAVYESPFPKKNRLNLIVPDATTKFTQRSETQFGKIADICAEITNNVPGNSAIFFPSYNLRDKVNYRFMTRSEKTQLQEEPGMSKDDKLAVLEKLDEYKQHGMVLLGVSSGSFGEGVDFPGDLLKCVIIVGLPLKSPDLETKQMIDYFDRKFGKGWNYGYIFPAFNQTLQNAGRCIRSETDKGVVIFLDERYNWNQYKRCFPKELNIKTTSEYKEEVYGFFNNGRQKTLFDEEHI